MKYAFTDKAHYFVQHWIVLMKRLTKKMNFCVSSKVSVKNLTRGMSGLIFIMPLGTALPGVGRLQSDVTLTLFHSMMDIGGVTNEDFGTGKILAGKLLS